MRVSIRVGEKILHDLQYVCVAVVRIRELGQLECCSLPSFNMLVTLLTLTTTFTITGIFLKQ